MQHGCFHGDRKGQKTTKHGSLEDGVECHRFL